MFGLPGSLNRITWAFEAVTAPQRSQVRIICALGDGALVSTRSP